QAEDGIRDDLVTGVQTCALPISIGKTLFLANAEWEIIGIVGDVRSVQVAEAPSMEFYRPWAQYNFPYVNITVRSNLKVDVVTKQIGRASCRERVKTLADAATNER